MSAARGGVALRALARLGRRGCSLLPVAVLLLGAAGQVVPEPPPPAPPPVAAPAPLAPIGADLLQIDRVLAERAPGLGLALRRRVAEAIVEESRQARFDPLFVLGLIQVESEFDGHAVSVAGARGLMQLRPTTAEYLAGLEGLRLTVEDIYRDPALQVRLGVRYLSRLERRFRSLDLGLMAYNAGPERLRVSLEQGDAERFRGYVRAVRRHHERFRRGAELAGEGALARADVAAEAARGGAEPTALP